MKFDNWIEKQTHKSNPWDCWPQKAREEIAAVIEHNKKGNPPISKTAMMTRLHDEYSIQCSKITFNKYVAGLGGWS